MKKSDEEKASAKFVKVMREFGKGTLKHGGTGKTVTKKDVALAIAYSESREIYPMFGHKRRSLYKFHNSHGGTTTILIQRSKKGKHTVTAVERGKKDPKTGFAKIIKSTTDIVNEKRAVEIEDKIKAKNPTITHF